MISWLRLRKAHPPKYPATPVDLTLYAIGDVHGRIDCLRRAQHAIDADRKALPGSQRALEIYIGDYVDRGPDSPAVLDNLIARAQQTDLVPLCGNHEGLMTSFLKGELSFDDWRGLGGLETVMAYGVPSRQLASPGKLRAEELAPRVPQAHLDFLSNLQYYFVIPPYCFVHAGLRPGVPLERQSMRDMTWIRDDFLNYRGPFGHIVVHGHTPVRSVEFHRHRINIDTGAYLSNRLSILKIDQSGPRLLATDPL